MLESKLPKLFILIRVVFGVVSGMFITPAVSQPNIVAFIGEKKTWCFVLIVDDPGICTIKKTVLQNDWFESFSNGCTLALNSEKSENVSVLGHHPVCLNWIVVVFAIIGELQLGLGVSTLCYDKQCQNCQ